MTPSELKAIRHSFGMSVDEFAALVRVEGRTVRRWEDGTREIPGTIDVLVYILENCPQARKLMGITLTVSKSQER